MLDFCKENSININSKKAFINYTINLPEEKSNDLWYSLEIYNLKCIDKLELYNKYKRLKKESYWQSGLRLLCG